MATTEFPSESLLAQQRAMFWREWEFWVLALVTAVLYGARLTALPIRGEETRRAQVACEMVETGDWIVPRQQGHPLLSRPPLGSYPIALAAIVFGDCSLLAVRLPTMLATLLSALLIYGYGRLFLSRLGALAAGLAYITLGQVLILGRLAETEATFTLLLSGALLAWHWGYSQRERRSRRFQLAAWPWLSGYGLAALAALAKGPQGPIYFAASVSIFLSLRRDWRTLLSWSHLAGLALFAVLVGAWQIPFWLQMGWPAVKTIWVGDVGMRFEDTSWQAIGSHLLRYPLEIAVCTLPWSPLLIGYFSKGFRNSLGAAKPYVVYLGVAVGFAFVTCWIVPGAKGRYFMPLYPCLALLIGLSVERVAEPAAALWLRRSWKVFLLSKAVLGLVAGLVVAGVSWIERFQLIELKQPGWFAAVYLTAAFTAAFLLRLTTASFRPNHMRISLLTLTALIGLSYVGVAINGMVSAAEDPAREVAELKQKLPPGARLVSFGLVETLFTYLYREPIEERPWPKSAGELGPDHDYFCFTWDRPQPPPLPFGWTIEGVIPCDRVHLDPPVKKVIVGRRIDSLAGR